MKTFHYITKDGEGWIKLENPYRRYLSYYGGILHDEHELHDKFEYANPPLKWVGDKLPEGTVLREEEIEPVYTMQDFEGNPFTITEAEYEKWKLFNHVSKAARLKSQLTQREGEPEANREQGEAEQREARAEAIRLRDRMYSNPYVQETEAKRCALVAIDVVLTDCVHAIGIGTPFYKFYEQVKIELQKL